MKPQHGTEQGKQHGGCGGNHESPLNRGALGIGTNHHGYHGPADTADAEKDPDCATMQRRINVLEQDSNQGRKDRSQDKTRQDHHDAHRVGRPTAHDSKCDQDTAARHGQHENGIGAFR
ncbi:MAG: hypothetical protein ABGX05_10445, partial [Pirellulaceae bacterium]